MQYVIYLLLAFFAGVALPVQGALMQNYPVLLETRLLRR